MKRAPTRGALDHHLSAVISRDATHLGLKIIYYASRSIGATLPGSRHVPAASDQKKVLRGKLGGQDASENAVVLNVHVISFSPVT
jgi:hypothetical protein